MVNYKKSFMSVAAAIAISSTALTAGYLPLTDGTNDNRWVLFGVTGFKTNGASATVAGAFSINTSLANTITDSWDADGLYTSGMTVGTNDFARLDAMVSGLSVEVRVDTSSPVQVVWDETDPLRTIYVDGNDDGVIDFSFTYKASLEGRTLQYQLSSSSSVYTMVIAYENTYSNPVVGDPVVDGNSSSGSEISSIEDTVDYDFAGNPVTIAEYDKDTYQTIQTNERLRLYSYDAQNEQWNIYDANNTADANDFDAFTKGKAYWGKIDADGDDTTTDADTQEAGFVLGSSTLSTSDYTSAGLTSGWNLMAFDSAQPDIRYASSGLLVTFVAAADSFTLEDFSGNHSVTVSVVGTDNSLSIAKKINSAIDQAKILGTIPRTFDLKAFPTDTTLQLALVSNKKFTIKDTNDAVIGAATTLTGNLPRIPTTKVDATIAEAADVDAIGVMSKYGEYSMLIDPLHQAHSVDAASNLAAGSSVQIIGAQETGATDASVVLSIKDIGTDLNDTQANLATHADLTGDFGNVVEIDSDINGTADLLLLSSVAPFYVRDYTFSRVYAYSGTATGADSTLVVKSPTIANKVVDTTDANATRAANLIDGPLMGVGTPSDDLTKMVFTMKAQDSSEFTIAETLGDNLKASATTSDMAKGAVKGIYSITNIASVAVVNNIDINITEVPDRNDTVQFTFDTVLQTGIVGTLMNPNEDGSLESNESNAADNLSLLDAYVAQINADFLENNITATASHNLADVDTGTAAGDLNASLITISATTVDTTTVSGSDIINVTTAVVNDVVENNETFSITFTAGADDTNTTTVDFDGIALDLNASSAANDLNSTANIVASFVDLYDTNGSGNFNITNDANTTLTFTQKVAALWTDTVFTDFQFANASTPVAGTDANVTVQGSAASVAEANITAVADLGYIGSLGDGDLTEDLKFNAVYTPNYVMDGPLYTMRENDMTLKALVTGTMSLSDGIVTWDSIDLTRPPSEWLASQDYNLFSIDSTSGYWAYLEEDATVSDLEITLINFEKNYTHNFDTQVATTDVPNTYNFYSGQVLVVVSGVGSTEEQKSARVMATVDGKEIELIRDNGSSDTFVGQISTYEAIDFSRNENPDISITVTDGIGNKISKTLAQLVTDGVTNSSGETPEFDNLKPAAPTMATTNGLDLNVTASDTDSVSIYLFENAVPENYVDGDELFSMTDSDTNWDGSTLRNICQVMTAVTPSDSAGSLVAISMDGDGELGDGGASNGNASNQTIIAYMPILKATATDARMYATNSKGSGVKTITSGGSEYDTACTVAAEHNSTGVALSAITDDTDAKIAYDLIASEDNWVSVPVTTYLSDGTNIVEITYDPSYIGSSAFVMINGKTYTHTLLSAAAIFAAGDGEYDSDPLDISGTELSGVTF